MAEPPKDPLYYAARSREGPLECGIRVVRDRHKIPWHELPGNVPQVQTLLWVGALKETLKRHEQSEDCSREHHAASQRAILWHGWP